MRLMRIIALLALAALPAAAQDAGTQAEADKTFLEGQIEGLLSGAGRAVTITGFRGALSSHATLERMTIADDRGVWLTLEDATLDWSRAALLRGRLEVNALTAATITLDRLPEAGSRLSPDKAEARGFALPELPVSVSVGKISAGEVDLGEAVLGEAATLSVEGRLELAGGTGDAALAIRRIGRDDRLTLSAAFDNTSRVLRVDLDFDEAAGGLVGRTLRIPDAPALRLKVDGEAPLSDFNAQVSLASDGARRLGGAVHIAAIGAEGTEDPEGYRFGADLAGDLRPLVGADLHPFFGESATLALAGQTLADGGTRIDSLRLEAGGIELGGTLALGADGWPERFDLGGRLGGEGRMRLPVPGPETSIEAARLSARYDAAKGEAWQADLRLDGLQSGPLGVGAARIGGEGSIARGSPHRLSADIVFAAERVTHAEQALAQALGTEPQGAATLRWQPGAPLSFERLTVTSSDASLTASGEIGDIARGLPVRGRAALSLDDLSRFAALAGHDLSGAAGATVQGSGSLLGGDFDIELAASTRDLATGTPRLDPLLAGRGTLNLAARRTTQGITLERLEIGNPVLRAEASGRLNGQSGMLDLTARLSDLSLAEPRLSGPARVETELNWQATGGLGIRRLEAEVAGAILSAEGTLGTADPALPVKGRFSLSAPDLTRFAAFSGLPLAGSADLSVEGSGEIAGRQLNGEIALDATDMRTGIAPLDRLTGGRIILDGRLGWGGGPPVIERLTLDAARMNLSAAAPAPGEPVKLTLKLADLGDLAPGINGAARLEGTLVFRDERGETVAVDLNFIGPGGTSARIGGQIAEFGQSLSLSAAGVAPLALANRIIAPRSITGPARFDLRLDGAPGLDALSGEIGIAGARVSVPGIASAIGNLTGTVRLGGGQAQLDISGDTGRGGQFRTTGPAALAPPFAARLETRFDRLGVADPALFETTLDGRIDIDGALAGGARITGALQLGPTELRVPSGGGRTLGALPPIEHVGAPAAVTQTRRRAGLIETGRPTPAAAYPLDLTIDAPSRIFVRGRGLDAELGGQLRLGGTTADVAASGVFELIRGRMDILTKRLELTEGLIDLRGTLDPWLRFVARTQTDDLTIDIVLEGLASDPQITFTSVPDLPQEEILARLLFGRGFDKMSAFQAAQLVSAVATLSGNGSGGLTGQLRGALGLSDFDITSTEDGATEVRAGAYISDKIYSEVSADSEGKNQINLNLDLTPSITVKGRADNAGDTGLGIFFERDY